MRQNPFGFLEIVASYIRPNCHELIRFWKRKRVEQHRVQYAENRGVRTNTERQRQNRNHREARASTSIRNANVSGWQPCRSFAMDPMTRKPAPLRD